MAEQRLPGFYGKVPTHGDFLSRNLPRTFIDAWDRWLQAALACSRDQLGEAWLDSYLVSPIWRFAISRGLAGPQAWMGVVLPGVDRVGRYFPLTLALPLPDEEESVLEMAFGAAQWFAEAEDVALYSLEDDFDLETFAARIEALGPLPTRHHPLPLAAETPLSPGGRFAWRLPLDDVSAPDQVASGLARHLMEQFFRAYSVWWTAGSQGVPSCLLACEGLPPVEGMAAMMNGDFDGLGWTEKHVLIQTPEEAP
jgi:type VI secretion system protein ImpM